MAKYATSEERYDCPRCLILCTKREMKKHEHYTWILSCPNCNLDILTVHDGEVIGVVVGAQMYD